LTATPWALEPSSSRAAKFISDQIRSYIPIIDHATVNAVAYGYSMPEVTYLKLGNGQVGIASISEKPIEWFTIDTDNQWRYHPDDGSGGYEGILCDPRKFFPIVRNPSTLNPYGESLLSRLYFPVTWRREGWQMWLDFLDTFGSPIVAANVRNYQGFVDAMRAQGVRSVVAWQGTVDDKLSTIQPSTAGEFERMELALTKRIQKLILGNTMTTDGGTYSSRASGEVGLTVEDSRRFADIRIGTPIIQGIINVLCDLNGFKPLFFERKDETGLEVTRSQRDASLAPVLQTSGFKFSRSYFTDNYALNDSELVDTVQITQEPIQNGMMTAGLSANRINLAPVKFTEAQQAVEDLGDDAMQKAGAFALDNDAIKLAVKQASDKADLERRLLILFENPDSRNKKYEETLMMADFAAQVLGYVAASDNKS
jgi:phage gp29-like protein